MPTHTANRMITFHCLSVTRSQWLTPQEGKGDIHSREGLWASDKQQGLLAAACWRPKTLVAGAPVSSTSPSSSPASSEPLSSHHYHHQYHHHLPHHHHHLHYLHQCLHLHLLHHQHLHNLRKHYHITITSSFVLATLP